MQGIFIDNRRPKSKKEIKDILLEALPPIDPETKQPETPGPNYEDYERITIEATSFFGDEYNGPLSDMPITSQVWFVGPDPYNNRKFYGNLTWNKKKGGFVVT